MAMTKGTRPVSADVRESMTTVEEYLREDPASPDALFERSTKDYGTASLSKECYVSPDWAHLEMDKLWKRVWQMACRVNDIPGVGDFIEYTIGNQSVIIVRDAPDSIKALQNSCMHRGTALVEGCGTRQELECTFHGWTWNLDGSLKRIPCRWDFPDVADEACELPQCRVGTWNGFVFINFDPDAPSLEEHLGKTVPRHFERWPLAQRWKAVHVIKPVPANWKVAFEAFVEDYHVFRTHPQIVPYAADCNSQYDIFDDLHGRMITAMGVASPHAGDQYSYQDTVDAMIGDLIADVVREQGIEVPIPQVPEGGTSRQVLAEFMRQSIGQRTGIDFSGTSDAEALDAIEYHIFPNLIPWGGFSFPLVYRYRPGPDPNWCLFDIMIFVPFPEGSEMPKDAAPVLLPAEGPFTDCAELGALGPVYDQDMLNMSRVQKGLQNDRLTQVNFAKYQEMNIRNFHANLGAYVEK